MPAMQSHNMQIKLNVFLLQFYHNSDKDVCVKYRGGGRVPVQTETDSCTETNQINAIMLFTYLTSLSHKTIRGSFAGDINIIIQ